MKISLLSFLVGVALPFSIFADSDPAGKMVVDANSLGAVTYTEWVDGAEKEVVSLSAKGEPQPLHFIWSKTTPTDYRPQYGNSNTSGVRYLRIGFNKDVTIGSILARGGGQVSVLKPGAAEPGNVTDDSQWIPAQRIKGGKVSTAEAGADDEVMWTLPTAVTTHAIRFTHAPQPTDRSFGSTVTLAIFPGRWANIAPQAIAATSSTEQHASRLNDENIKVMWENISLRDGERQKTIAEDPEWGMLVWPAPVTLQGAAFLGNEWGTAEVQAYTGPATKHPREAAESDWKTIQTISGVKPPTASLLNLIPVFFDAPVTTRALRVRFTKTLDEANLTGNSAGRTKGGKRVALGEWMALEQLNDAAIQTAVIPAAQQQLHGPIPIRFALAEGGEVTLVIEDSTGKRVRNLVSQTPFPKGDNVVWWDGTDDLARDPEAAEHGIYLIPPEFVAPGTYTVRGLWHKPLDLRYEMVVDAPGEPPWTTADGSGAWMTSHTPASCALYVPAEKSPSGQPLVYLGDAIAEGGSALSWLNLEGKKVGGRGWIGGSWTGAQYLASDSGSKAEPGVYAYVGSTMVGNKKYGVNGKVEIRLTKLTTGGDRPVITPNYLCDPIAKGSFGTNAMLLGGLAVHDGLLVFSQTALNQLVFVDVKEGKVLTTVPLQGAGALAFDSKGRLLACAGKLLLRFTLDGAPSTLPKPETLVSDLDDAEGITLDSSDKIYVSDQGASHQVKIYSPDGKPVTVIGHAGVPKAGAYDTLHMNHPKGLAVDSNGRIWVTEDNFQPKRVSVWNPDGTLWKAYYGGPRYGGGGIIDSKDKTRFMYDGMEFRLDWDKGTYDLAKVFYLEGAGNLPLAFRDAAPEAPVYFDGHRYLTDAFDSGGTAGHDTAFIFSGDGDIAVPLAGAGSANQWDILKGDEFKSRWPAGLDPNGERSKNQAFFIWSDLNGDGQVQPDEVTIQAGSGGGITVGEDGSFLASRVGPKEDLHAKKFKPVRFTDKGTPVYDLAAGEVLAPAQGPGSDGGDQILTGTGGWVVMTTPPPPFSKFGIGGAKDGKAAWSYPSLWPGLHASHSSAAPDRLGELVGTTRLLAGLVTPKGEAGPLFFLNSNQGDIYSFTQDGLFVAQLFQDVRQGKLWEMPVAQRNMPLNDITLHDENFFPAVATDVDGTVYIMSGGNMGIVRVDNIDTIRRIPQMEVKVSADDLKKANDFVVARETERQSAQGSGVLAVTLRPAAPSLDGNLTEWNDAQWVPIDHRGVAAYFDSHTKPYDVSGAVTVADGKLFAAWKTGDPKLIENAGDAPNALFKTGGALDLMIGSDPNAKPNRAGPVRGDERLLVSKVGGKIKALLYHPVMPGASDKDKVQFAAPWHSISMDRVEDVSDKVEFG
ncbi:MAG: hypothetical protein WCD79_03170, partial [Chthoniobacteraceae bacterium]